MNLIQKLFGRKSVAPAPAPAAIQGSASLLKSGGGMSLLHVSEHALSNAIYNTSLVDGSYPWPIDPAGLLTLYLSSPEHCRAIHIKAAAGYGQGIEWEKDADESRFESLNDTIIDLFESVSIDMETYGNAFIERIRGPNGRLIGLEHRPAIYMSRMADGRFRQKIYDHSLNIVEVDFEPEEMLHIRPSCPGGYYYAYPEWIGAGGMMELASSAIEYNRAFFQNSAVPEYVAMTKGFSLSAEQKEAVRSFFAGEYRGVNNAHRTLYINTPNTDSEISFQRITAETKDADFVKMMDAARERMPTAHGVPPRLLGIMHAGQLGGANEVSAQFEIFEKMTLAPKRRKMTDQILPILKELGIKRKDMRFVGLDLTSTNTESEHLSEWMREGIIDREEARSMAHVRKSGSMTPQESADYTDALIKELLK